MTYTGETVTLIRESPGGFDSNGDPIASTFTEIAIADVEVAPRALTQPTERGDEGVIVGWSLYAPPGVIAYHTDQVRVRGVVCRVEGEVADWPMGVVINCVRA